MTDLDLSDQVVVVTGAAGRLGRNIVQRFLRNGATIAAVVRNAQEAASLSFLEATAGSIFVTDVTQEAEVEACFRQIQKELGVPEVLVHTVGGWGMQPLLETTVEDWERLVQLNLTSTFLCFREAIRTMKGGGGRLIGITAAQGADQGRAQQGAYSAAKAGVVRLVESIAEEFADTGLTAHAIAPSMILYEGMQGEKGVPVAHLADLCLYLASEAGSTHNGATLRAYGN